MASNGYFMDAVEPSTLETERCVLGIVLMDGSLLPDIASILTPSDFYDMKNKKIFRKMLDMKEAGEDINSISLLETGLIEQRDLVSFLDDSIVPQLWQNRCIAIKKYSIRRNLFRLAGQITKRAKDPEWEVTGANVMAISNAITELCPPDTITSTNNPFTGLSKYAQELRSMGGVRFGTGLPSVDRFMAGGVIPGQSMNIVGAQGSMKTSLALSGAKAYIKRSGRKVIYLCIDPSMSQDEIRNRLLQAELEVDNRWIIDSILNDDPEVISANEKLSREYGDRLLVIEGLQTVDSIARLVEKERPGAVIYDYLSAISGFRNDYDLANVVMTDLNELAKKYKFVNVFLHQMSRQSKLDQRNGNFGNHAKGGGAIEERVSVELELAVYEPQVGEEDMRGARLLSFVKNRNGQAETLIVKTLPHAMVFLDQVSTAKFDHGERKKKGWVKSHVDF